MSESHKAALWIQQPVMLGTDRQAGGPGSWCCLSHRYCSVLGQVQFFSGFFIDSVSGISHSADSRASLLAVGVEAHASTPITSG